MSAGGSNIAILAAIVANILIAVSKFIAAAFTGSSAMFSEGIHSMIDILNGLLLLLGIKRSRKKPTKLHPFGYGMEAYFWSFVVSILVFSVGGGFAIYEGIHRLTSPSMDMDHSHILWNYGVLMFAMIFEGTSLYIGIRQFRKTNPVGMRSSLKKSKDSPTVAVIFEETAAVIGNGIALAGVTLSFILHDPFYDALASIMIGILLIYVAYFMATETKNLLIGESITDEDMALIVEILNSYKEVDNFGNIRTMHLGPTEILITMEVNFKDNLKTTEVEQLTIEIKDKLSKKNNSFRYIYIETSNIEKSKL
ncbi:MAG: cation diffusion facilitator family transporter [Saprospiraceae bacterium]|nr:cation diffusion facilitator family transporter [Saprospiraceae bacterium]